MLVKLTIKFIPHKTIEIDRFSKSKPLFKAKCATTSKRAIEKYFYPENRSAKLKVAKRSCDRRSSNA